MRRKINLIIIFSIILSSCITNTPTAANIVEPSPTTINTPAPLYNIKTMSFNILYGGGADPEWEKKLHVLSSFWVGKDRLTNLKKFIKEVDPDIIGLQEAAGWDNGNPSVVQTVARELGMYYYLAEAEEGMVNDVVLLSKFEITEAEKLPIEKYAPYGLKAKIKAPDGNEIYIYVIHLSGSNDTLRKQSCEIHALIQHMQPYMQNKIILMGDFNMNRGSDTYLTLENSGMVPVQIESGRGIDQIWASPSLVWSKTKWFKNVFVPIDISDHNPVAVEMEIFPGSTENFPSTPPLPSTTADPLECEP